MRLLEGREWPAALREELEREVSAISAEEMFKGCGLKEICPPGFRQDRKNAALYRRNLAGALLRGDVRPEVLDFFRHRSYYQDFVCVLSTLALTLGFDALAAFAGGARLVLGMLLDVRPAVRAKALEFIDSGAEYPPVPADPDRARAELARTFEPFVKAFSEVAVAQNVTVVNREEGDRRLIATLQEELRRGREARTAAEQSAREAAKRVGALEQEIRRKEEALAEADRRQEAANTALATSSATLEEAVRELETVRRRADRLENQQRDLIRFRDECFQGRARIAALERSNGDLAAEIELLKEENRALREAGGARDREELRSHLDVAPEPETVVLSPRERLAVAVGETVLSEERRIIILLDGHNVLHLIPSLAVEIDNMSHEDLRRELVAAAVRARTAFGNCQMEVFFDGPVANVSSPSPSVRVHYSGGVGDHRADGVLLDHLQFCIAGGAFCVVVTEDGDMRHKARLLGAHVIASRDFSVFLPGLD